MLAAALRRVGDRSTVWHQPELGRRAKDKTATTKLEAAGVSECWARTPQGGEDFAG